MGILIIVGIAFLLFMSVILRTIVFHPFKTVFYFVYDLYRYFKYRQWRVLETGKLICYTALFGKGKTLSVVHYICGLYYQYNDKMIWDRERCKFVKQKIDIISNVDLKSVPYTEFKSLSQIVAVAENNHQLDLENDTLTCTLVLGDEFSVQMNSRNFKSNIDPMFLNTLLTCRHHHITMVYDAQRFMHVDALLRQVTSYVVECNKVWRIMVSSKYDAWDLENAQSPKMCQPIRRFGWFIRNKDFSAYDTYACVGNLIKSCKSGDMLTEAEIIDLQHNNGADMDVVGGSSRLYRRNKRKLLK